MSRDAWFVATLSRSLNRRMTAAVTRSLTRVASVAAVGVLAGALALLAAPVGASAGTTERVSVAISADGRFVAFASSATNLVPGDTNGQWDVFVHDRQTRTTERVSVDSAGNQGNWGSGAPALSADGRFVAFCSSATNFVAGDTNWAKDMYGFDNPAADVFVHDRVTRTTERVNVDSFANQADGGHSSNPSISANGRFIAFDSVAPNLVLGDTNGANDVFVHDRRSPDRGNGGTGAE